jgi:hypothetical protein
MCGTGLHRQDNHKTGKDKNAHTLPFSTHNAAKLRANKITDQRVTFVKTHHAATTKQIPNHQYSTTKPPKTTQTNDAKK